MKPYYQDDLVTLYHGDCRVGLPLLDEKSAVIITDPPYSDFTHENVRANSAAAKRHGNRVLSGNFGFDSITEEDLRTVLVDLRRITKSWIVSTLDYKHAFRFDAVPPAGLRMLRIGVWVKPNPMPQISGDRPAPGWEAIAFLHRDDVRPAWNGGGRAAVWTIRSEQRVGHPTAKPLPMVRDWVGLFSNPGDVILDPYAGSGTTLRAAVDLGRKSIGFEAEERYCELIAKRVSQQAFDLEGIA